MTRVLLLVSLFIAACGPGQETVQQDSSELSDTEQAVYWGEPYLNGDFEAKMPSDLSCWDSDPWDTFYVCPHPQNQAPYIIPQTWTLDGPNAFGQGIYVNYGNGADPLPSKGWGPDASAIFVSQMCVYTDLTKTWCTNGSTQFVMRSQSFPVNPNGGYQLIFKSAALNDYQYERQTFGLLWDVIFYDAAGRSLSVADGTIKNINATPGLVKLNTEEGATAYSTYTYNLTAPPMARFGRLVMRIDKKHRHIYVDKVRFRPTSLGI